MVVVETGYYLEGGQPDKEWISTAKEKSDKNDNGKMKHD
jgi:hypothetical protein